MFRYSSRKHWYVIPYLNPVLHVCDICRRTLHLLLQVLQLPLHPLLRERHRVHLLLQLVAQDRRRVLARLLMLENKTPDIETKLTN